MTYLRMTRNLSEKYTWESHAIEINSRGRGCLLLHHNLCILTNSTYILVET